MKVERLISQCDLDLKQGRADLVHLRLKSLKIMSVNRENRLPLAKICRRAGLNEQGLKLLGPLMHPEKNPWRLVPKASEISEYAILLSKNGNTLEALRRLDTISDSALAEVTLHRAYCHMARWEYADAVLHLERFLATAPDAYDRLVALVNLAACEILLQRWDRAREILSEIIPICRKQHYKRLLANTLELRGQVHLSHRCWRKADDDLNTAAALLASEATADALFIEKWRAFVNGLRDNCTDPIRAFRLKAEIHGHWESVRDADRVSLKICFDETQFQFLLYGTSFASYRQLICEEFHHSLPSGAFIWGDATAAMRLDLRHRTRLSPVLCALLSDFYRPIRLGVLFTQLYPSDQFDVFSSYNRLHQALWRARLEIEKNHLPLKIVSDAGGFRLVRTGSVAVALPFAPVPPDFAWVQAVRERFANQRFSAAEACVTLRTSRTRFQRWAREKIDEGTLSRTFSGNAICYRLMDHPSGRLKS